MDKAGKIKSEFISYSIILYATLGYFLVSYVTLDLYLETNVQDLLLVIASIVFTVVFITAVYIEDKYGLNQNIPTYMRLFSIGGVVGVSVIFIGVYSLPPAFLFSLILPKLGYSLKQISL